MKRSIGKYIFITLILILFIDCTSSSRKVEDEKLTENLNQLPPGTAQICGTMLETKDTSGIFVCLVKIDTVFGYGHSTPTLAAGTQLEVNISENSFKQLGGKSHFFELLNSKSKFFLELKSQKLLSFDQNNAQQWSITNLSLNKYFKN